MSARTAERPAVTAQCPAELYQTAEGPHRCPCRPSSDAGDVVEYQVRVESMIDATRQAARNAQEDVQQRLERWRLPESLGVRTLRNCGAALAACPTPTRYLNPQLMSYGSCPTHLVTGHTLLSY